MRSGSPHDCVAAAPACILFSDGRSKSGLSAGDAGAIARDRLNTSMRIIEVLHGCPLREDAELNPPQPQPSTVATPTNPPPPGDLAPGFVRGLTGQITQNGQPANTTIGSPNLKFPAWENPTPPADQAASRQAWNGAFDTYSTKGDVGVVSNFLNANTSAPPTRFAANIPIGTTPTFAQPVVRTLPRRTP
jgi:hypothetical protein